MLDHAQILQRIARRDLSVSLSIIPSGRRTPFDGLRVPSNWNERPEALRVS